MLRAPLPTTLNYNLAIHSNDSFWTVQKEQASLSALLPTTPRRPVQTERLRRGDLVKLLWWDGDGLCLFAKRLERGRFVWPRAEEGGVVLTRAQLSMLLEGIDWRMPRRTWRPELAG